VRKVVLATAIAETSLTIEDVRVVVDTGRARRSRFDPARGMARLVTEPVTKAEAEQRRGRAGRVAPGTCYRMWAKAEEGALAAFPPPEIAEADLAGLALELAAWGAEPEALAFLTPPPAPALAEARALLAALGALDGAGRITPHGRALAALPLHPRLGHMLAVAGPAAAPLAALLSDRDPMPGAGADLAPRLAALRDPRRAPEAARGALDRIAAEARRLERLAPSGDGTGLSPGAMAALAYPDRIGMRRPGEAPRYLLSGGRGALAAEGEPLGREAFVVATDLDGGAAAEARLRGGLPLGEADLRRLFSDRIGWAEHCTWSRREGRVLARRQERLGALVLAEGPWEKPPAAALARAAREGLRQQGLAWPAAAARLRDRVRLLQAEGADLPDVSDAAILADPEDALLSHLAGMRTAADLARLDLMAVLEERLGWEARREVDRLAPAAFTTPLGRQVPIDYGGEAPTIAVRLQEMFGVTVHPVVGPKRRPLAVTLLSPAGRPVQVTSDLPGFWAASYAEVRKEMRGRYPRHPWPEDPTRADPTLRAKPRGT
jgi:ATP-dependent helicase HrpB